MSRKTIFAVIGVLGAVFAYIAKEFGLSIDVMAIMAGLVSILVYVFGEAKNDFARIGRQIGRFKDPKFILAIIAVFLSALNKNFGTGIPVEAVIAVLTVIMGLLFKKEHANLQ